MELIDENRLPCGLTMSLNSELYFSGKHATLARADGVSSEEPLGISKSTGKAENDKGQDANTSMHSLPEIGTISSDLSWH